MTNDAAFIRVPAVNTSSARAFPFVVTADGTHWLLQTTHGAVVLDLPVPVPRARFTMVRPTIAPVDDARSRGFVEDLAMWLGAVAREGSPSGDSEVELSAVYLGEGLEGAGIRWEGYKLSAAGHSDEDGYAELFLRVSRERTQAQVLEKWSAYRPRLPALFERILGLPVRRWVERPVVDAGPGEEIAWFHGAIGFAVPTGWTRTEVAGGSIKLVDPTDEFGFEVSVLRVPPIDALTLLGMMLGGEPRAAGARAAPLEHPVLQLATAEYAWEEADPHRAPQAPHREARCRWLVAREGAGMGFLTFVYWTDDGAVALPHWDRAVRTLVLGSPAEVLVPDLAMFGGNSERS